MRAAARLVLRKDRARILAGLLRARHRFARRVLLALQILDERNQPPPLGFERGQLRELRRRIQPARAQPRFDDSGGDLARTPGSSIRLMLYRADGIRPRMATCERMLEYDP